MMGTSHLPSVPCILDIKLTFPNLEALGTEIITVTHLEKYLAYFDCFCNIKIIPRADHII